MRILLFVFVMLISVKANAGDIEKYINAYKVIKDSSIVDKCFSEYCLSVILPNEICVSDRIYYIDKLFFLEDIINYEHNIPVRKSEIWKKLLDSLITLEYKLIDTSLKTEKYREIPALNKLQKSIFCDLKIFFGEIENQNRLRASLVCNKGTDDYGYSIRQSQFWLEYLFYFKGDDVEKVIIRQCIR